MKEFSVFYNAQRKLHFYMHLNYTENCYNTFVCKAIIVKIMSRASFFSLCLLLCVSK